MLADLRERHRVAPVRYHGKLAWMITRFDDLQQAFADATAQHLGGIVIRGHLAAFEHP